MMRPLVGAFLMLFTSTWCRAADTYKVDGVHSAVIFRVKHVGVSYSYGRFNDVSGTFSIDAGDPTKNSFDIKVKTASIDTADKKRDKHLEGPDFFNAKQYPLLTFKSKSVKSADDGKLHVTGDLTCRDVTKEITVEMDIVGQADTQMGAKAGFETTFTINRQEFGVAYGPGVIGDDVRITVSIEGDKK